MIHEAGFDDTFYYFGNERQIRDWPLHHSIFKPIQTHCFPPPSLSRLDYCNQLFVGVTGRLLDKLQSFQNAAARLVTGAGKFDRITCDAGTSLATSPAKDQVQDSRSGLQVPPWTGSRISV